MSTFRQDLRLSLRRFGANNGGMNYTSPEQRWIAEKTREIFVECRVSTAEAIFVAFAEWERMRKKPKAEVISVARSGFG